MAAWRKRENVAAATFLAGAALAIAPTMLSWLDALGLLATPSEHVTQLFKEAFTNQQVLASSLAALATSGFCWWRLKMTGFAWTTAALTAASYLSLLLLFDWLDQKPETQALWCLPLVGPGTPGVCAGAAGTGALDLAISPGGAAGAGR